MIGWLRAVSVGSAVPRHGFEGTVHSVFHRAANLRLPGEPVLLTLVLSEEADLPQGIRLEARGRSAFEGLLAGVRAACEDGILVVGDSLTVDLRAASTWECDLSVVVVDMRDAAVATAWDHAWHTLQERQARAAPLVTAHQTVLAQHLEIAERAILGATTKYDLDGMSSALGALIGFGIGLTPSGDDFLTGYLAGLWCTTRNVQEREDFLSALAQLVVDYSARTNDIARTYLLLAARGQVSRRLVDLARDIGRGADADSVVSSAQAAMQLGHSSGMETVTGLLLGLAAWDRPDMALPF